MGEKLTTKMDRWTLKCFGRIERIDEEHMVRRVMKAAFVAGGTRLCGWME